MWPQLGVIFNIFSSWLPHGHQPIRIGTDFSTEIDSRRPRAVLGVNPLEAGSEGGPVAWRQVDGGEASGDSRLLFPN